MSEYSKELIKSEINKNIELLLQINENVNNNKETLRKEEEHFSQIKNNISTLIKDIGLKEENLFLVIE
jgi:DNA-binding transcriptional regulator GbsR (MarR family)